MRLALLLVCVWYAGGSLAAADTLTVAEYQGRLREARTLLVQARSSSAGARQPLVDRARELLLRTEAVRGDSGAAQRVDDAPLAEIIAPGDAQLAQAIAHLDASIAFAAGTSGGADAAAADARLREVLAARDIATAPSLAAVLQRGIDAVVTRVLVGLREMGIEPEAIGRIAVAGLALAIVLVLAAIFGPALRERIRAEAVQPAHGASQSAVPADHLRLADAARAARRDRDALHHLYLYALTSLVAGEALRYDPALTDHELLLRAAGLPQVGALRELVTLHERTWFGLREPSAVDADRARALAVQVAA